MIFYLLMLAFRFFLDASYFLFVNPVFGYSGFSLGFSGVTYGLSWLIYLVSLPVLRARIFVISDYFFITFVLFVIAPITSLYGLTGWSVRPVVVTVFSFFLLFFIVKSSRVKVPYFPVVRQGNNLAIFISSGMMLFLVVWYFISGASFNLNFASVYDFRAENAELSSGGILAYTNNWTYKIFSIFFISYFLWKKNWFLVVLGCLAQVVFYGYSAHKSVLFSLLLIFGIWFWFGRSDKAYVLPLGLIFVFCGGLFFYFALDHLVLGSMLIRRVFYIPAYLTYQYFDFFSSNQFVYWSNSFLSGFVDYPYDLSISMTIGQYEGSGGGANNGYISSGYAHFGYWGVFIYTVIFALVLRFLDVVTKNSGVLWLGLAISIVPLRDALISSDLLTTLLTHGLIVIIFLVLLIKKNPAYEN
ncbi:hypothetical protein [Stutzerimonas degradans]|uniref:hypothetical protein n=1 Tax=Stutzerimonas degradans TaxID=2968968 RepID=UPI00141E8B9B|nr:hypothetical protein [Stutzerimonas degradans]NHW03469.1 hypothetical protein [Stutzerimonas degradans]